jgi:hypothetical protein
VLRLGQSPGCSACCGLGGNHTEKCRERFTKQWEEETRKKELRARTVVGTESVAVEQPKEPVPKVEAQSSAPAVVQESQPPLAETGGDEDMTDAARPSKAAKLSDSNVTVGALTVCVEDWVHLEVIPSLLVGAVTDEAVVGTDWKPNVMEGVTEVWGTKSGEALPLDKVEAGRIKEVSTMTDHGMYELWPVALAKGKKVRTGWVEDWGKEAGSVRCRLVAKEINYFKRADISQNTPPLVVIRLMISLAASVVDASGMHCMCLAVWDCCHAFYHAAINEEIYAIPPRGLAPPGYL